MKLNISKAVGAAFVAVSAMALTGCYDLDDLSRNPYAIEDDRKDESGGSQSVDDGTKYSDINVNDILTVEELAACKTDLNAAPTTFRNFLYEGYYADYQITTNLSHDIYGGYVANNQPKHAQKSPDFGYSDGWSGQRWKHFYEERCSEYRSLMRAFKYASNPDQYKNQIISVH